MERDEKLTLKVKKYSKKIGVDFIGFADPAHYGRFPKYNQPRFYLEGSQTVIILGFHLQDIILDAWNVNQQTGKNYHFADLILEKFGNLVRDFLTKQGDCIIGINANKSVKDLNLKLKHEIQEGKQIRIVIKSGSYQDEFIGWGNPNLSLSNPVSMVFRKSNFISDRTILVNCSKASLDIKRELINHLQDPAEQILIQFYSID